MNKKIIISIIASVVLIGAGYGVINATTLKDKLPWRVVVDTDEEHIELPYKDPNYPKIAEERKKRSEERAKNNPTPKRQPPSEHKPALAPLVHTFTDEGSSFSLKYSDDLKIIGSGIMVSLLLLTEINQEMNLT